MFATELAPIIWTGSFTLAAGVITLLLSHVFALQMDTRVRERAKADRDHQLDVFKQQAQREDAIRRETEVREAAGVALLAANKYSSTLPRGDVTLAWDLMDKLGLLQIIAPRPVAFSLSRLYRLARPAEQQTSEDANQRATEYAEAVLGFINALRQEYGVEPLPGVEP